MRGLRDGLSRDVLDYDHAETYHPFNVELSTAADDCVHGSGAATSAPGPARASGTGRSSATRPCSGEAREPDEVTGVRRGVFLARATDPGGAAPGQDGGLVSALLMWGLETGRIEGALTSRLSSTRTWDGEPFLAGHHPRRGAGGGRLPLHLRGQPMAMREAERRGLKRLALVGMSCQASINGTLQARRVSKYARRIEITLGLLCSKSFAYAGLNQVITEDYGVPLDDIAKVNIKGRFQLWRRSTGELIEIPLKQLRQATREGASSAPTSRPSTPTSPPAASASATAGPWPSSHPTRRGLDAPGRGGRRDHGPARREDPAALALMARVAARSRERWPAELTGDQAAPRILPVVQTSGGTT